MHKGILITYKINAPANKIPRIAEDIALEQTVELPKEAIFYKEILRRIVGKIESIESNIVKISYDISTTDLQLPQFLNLLFGNISLNKGIRIIDLKLPKEFVKGFKGPNYGIQGLRRIFKIEDRPLVAAALKPKGLSASLLSRWCSKFALAGLDIIKDDHGICGDFDKRVKLCQEVVDRVKQKTGKEILYFPNLTAPFEDIEKRIEYGLKIGIRGFLLSPFLIGLDYFRYLSQNYPLIFMAHPAFSGSLFMNDKHGISTEIILGRLFRLIGADIVIFPNFGGRFPFTRETCYRINNSLKEEFYHLKKTMPAPAGGIDLKDIPLIRDFYGDDIVILIGASLYLGLGLQASKDINFDNMYLRNQGGE